MLGQLLDGRYKVIQVLSAGGFGETYIVEDTRRPGNPRCVLKLLKPVISDPHHLQVARRLFNILIIAAISLGVVPLVRPKIFRRQDILLIIALLISGINLLVQGKYLDELPQFSLILLAISAVLYTAESLRLRIKNTKS